MPLRKRHGKWNIRFWVNGHEYTEPTDLAATERNRSAAARIEAELYGRVLEGKSGTLRLKVQPFREAAEQFLVWADSEHREHPNTGRRLRTSFVSLSAFFKSFAVSSITSGNVEDYKAWRRVEHKVREITLRHDLHALSKFYRYAIKHNWATENPVRGVTMPSDLDAVRMHVLTPSEEAQYFFTALSEFEVTHKGETHAGPFQDLHDVAKLILLQGEARRNLAPAARAHRSGTQHHAYRARQITGRPPHLEAPSGRSRNSGSASQQTGQVGFSRKKPR